MDAGIHRAIGSRSVDVAHIESELTNLWRDRLSSLSSGDGAPIMRVCTSNLLVYVDDPSRLDSIKKIVDLAAAKKPLRAIYLIVDPSIVDTKGSVSGSCKMLDGDGVQICCEQIFISVPPEHEAKLKSAAIENIIPDLPVSLLWLPTAGPNGRFLRSLIPFIDNLIVDSDACHEERRLLADVLVFANTLHGVRIGDIAWDRTLPWRISIAMAFDRKPMSRLHEITNVSINYVEGCSHSQSALSAGWIASRMGWKLHRSASSINHRIQSQFNAPDGTQPIIDINQVESKNAGNQIATIEQITFGFLNESPITLNLDQSSQYMLISLLNEDSREELVQMPTDDLSAEAIIPAEISDSRIDSMLIDSLEMTVGILQTE